MGDSGKHNYHNQETGETTWEKPADLLPDNGSESSAGSDSDLEKRKKRENESGAKAHESPREFSDEEFAYEGDAVAEDAEEMPSKKPAELSNADGAASSDSQAARRESKWEEHFDEDSRRTYYHHEETGKTTWEKPAELSDRESESSDGHDTPWKEHWEEHFHEDSGKHNYHNQETGETTSEKPADLLPDNGSESSAGSDSDLEKRKKRENESGAKAHESPREFSDEEFAYEGDAVAEDEDMPLKKPAELSNAD